MADLPKDPRFWDRVAESWLRGGFDQQSEHLSSKEQIELKQELFRRRPELKAAGPAQSHWQHVAELESRGRLYGDAEGRAMADELRMRRKEVAPRPIRPGMPVKESALGFERMAGEGAHWRGGVEGINDEIRGLMDEMGRTKDIGDQSRLGAKISERIAELDALKKGPPMDPTDFDQPVDDLIDEIMEKYPGAENKPPWSGKAANVGQMPKTSIDPKLMRSVARRETAKALGRGAGKLGGLAGRAALSPASLAATLIASPAEAGPTHDIMKRDYEEMMLGKPTPEGGGLSQDVLEMMPGYVDPIDQLNLGTPELEPIPTGDERDIMAQIARTEKWRPEVQARMRSRQRPELTSIPRGDRAAILAGR